MFRDEHTGQGSAKIEKTKLGEILLRRGQVRRFQLEFLLDIQKAYFENSRKQIPIGQLLLDHSAIQEHSLKEALSLQTELPTESITQILAISDLDDDQENVTKLIPREDL